MIKPLGSGVEVEGRILLIPSSGSDISCSETEPIKTKLVTLSNCSVIKFENNVKWQKIQNV